jgi:hypothetical protein
LVSRYRVLGENFEVDRIARARELFELGRHRAALDLLKPAAAEESAPFAHRRALAQLYRELGYLDQAGRWGIVLEGWTTDAEQDRLARMLAAQDVPARSAREYLAVPRGTAAPVLDALVEDRVPTYRAQFAAKAARQPKTARPPMTPAARAGDVGFGFGVAAAFGAIAGLAVVFFIALIGGEAQATAGVAALIVLLLISLAFAAFGIAQILEGRIGAGTSRIGVGVVLLAIIAGALLFLAAA